MCRPVVFFVWFAAGWGFPGSIPGRGFHVGRRGFHKRQYRSAPCRAGDRKCPALIWFRRAFGSASGGCSGTLYGRFESFPEPVRVAVVVDRSAVQSRSESGRGSC